MTRPLRIAHLPNHGPSVNRQVVDKFFDHDWDSASLSEGYKAVPILRQRKDVVTVTGSGGPRKDRYGRVPSYDNPILAPRRGSHNLSAIKITGSARVSKAFWANLKWNPERWMVWVVYTHPVSSSLICHITVHPTIRKGLQRKALRALKHKIAWARALGFLVVVTGDLQTKDAKPSVPNRRATSLRPVDIFIEAGLDYRVQHLDWIAWDKRLECQQIDSLGPRQIAPGQDHPWLFATFTARSTR